MVILKTVIGKSEMVMIINISLSASNGWLIRLVGKKLINQSAVHINEGVDEGISEGVLVGLLKVLVLLYIFIKANNFSK